MKQFFRRLRRIILALVIATIAVGIWKRDDITRLLAVNNLFTEANIVGNFSNMQGLFFHTVLSRGVGPVSPLPPGPPFALPPETTAWISDRKVTSLVILKDGQLVFEDYYLGTGPDDLRISWSVAKSFLSALIGILLDDGTIASIDDPVTKYVPSLIGSAYDGATLRNVLQMSSGVKFNEDYLDFNSDINRMGRVLALGGSMDGFAAGLTERIAEPGTAWQYVSIDTHVVAMVASGASGRPLVDLMDEKIIQPLGLEADPVYLTDGYGVAFALGGLNLRTRDYARMGQMMANGGQWQGKQIVPAAWIAAATVPSAKTAPGATGYGYQWWIPVGANPGQFMARGIYGQYVYIDQINNVVIATTAADRNFENAGVDAQNEAMFRLIADRLSGG
jgi:CubicO group peptidase (beta-lactamase class C family)